MRSLTCILAATALTVAAVGVQTKPTAIVQSNTSRPLQTGYVLKQIPFSALHHRQAGGPRIRFWESTSGNWSGYAVPMEGSDVNDTFSNVQGTWIVPAVTGDEGSVTYSSAWVGLDGYENGTVEQAGTEQDWMGGRQQNYVWFEMYPNYAYEIIGFPVNIGDSITVKVHYTGQTKVQYGRQTKTKTINGKNAAASVFQITIKNVTRNVSFSVPTSYTTTTSAARASAEWVMEAPSSMSGILPLADFDTAEFSGCTATSTGSSGKSESISFWPSDPMTMINPSGEQATPSSLLDNGTAFSVSWSQ
jgi:hypothetical protein